MFSGLIKSRALAFAAVVVFSASTFAGDYPRQSDSVQWPGKAWPEADGSEPYGRGELEAEIRKIYGENMGPFFEAARGVVVIHKGKLVAEAYRDGYNRSSRFVSWSQAKSITQALVGIAVREGLLEVTAPATVPEWAGDERAAITLEDLLRMSSGLKFEEGAGGLDDNSQMLFGDGRTDVGTFAINQPLIHEPGKHWGYATGTSMVVSRIVRDAVVGNGDNYYDFIHRELIGPLGMTSAVPEMDKSGTFLGGTSFYATTRDYARFGLLYLRDGMWNGQRILPEGWVDFSRSETPNSGGNYGVHFWLNPLGGEQALAEKGLSLPDDMFQARGMGGQFIAIFPSRDVVIAYNGFVVGNVPYSPIDGLFARLLNILEVISESPAER